METLRFVFLLGIVMFVPGLDGTGFGDDGVILARRKRYVAFPDGSTMIFALCATDQTILPFSVFTEGVNWGIAYDLPNRTTFNTFLDKPRSYLRRRHRRDLYDKAEILMDSMGLDGRACIYRALCEATRFTSKSKTLSEAIIRLLFKFPQQAVSDLEPEEHRLYHWAYRKGRLNKQRDCAEMFPTCSISLIGLALGYYGDHAEEVAYET